MKKTLITGAAGFIGFHLCKKLAKKNFEVIGVDNFNTYYDRKLKLSRSKILSKDFSIKVHNFDLKNKIKLEELFNSNDFTYVFHLAAQAGVRYSLYHPGSYIDSNLVGTFNLLESIKNNKIKHFLFASTSSVYGNRFSKKGFIEKDDSSHPLSLYAASKKSCENLIHSYSYNFKIRSTILRFFSVYGPWGRPDMALFKFIKSIEENRPIDVYNKGKMWRDFTYVDDLVNSIYELSRVLPIEKNRVDNDSLSSSASFRIVNIGNQKAIELNEFINQIKKVTNRNIKFNYLPMQMGDVPFTLSNCSLLRKLVGFTPKTDIYDGIKNFYSWYRKYYKV